MAPPLVFDLSMLGFTGLHCKPEEQIIKVVEQLQELQ